MSWELLLVILAGCVLIIGAFALGTVAGASLLFYIALYMGRMEEKGK